VRFLIRVLFALAANAIALLLAAALLDGVTIDGTSFVFAVVIFSLASLLLRPLLAMIIIRSVRPLAGVVALITTFLILLLTDVLSDGLNIDGTVDWILATLIVWLATVLYEIFDLRIQRLVLGKPGPAG
jgi:uncharacterized membrane protein YvlD (DUF360 family)